MKKTITTEAKSKEEVRAKKTNVSKSNNNNSLKNDIIRVQASFNTDKLKVRTSIQVKWEDGTKDNGIIRSSGKSQVSIITIGKSRTPETKFVSINEVAEGRAKIKILK
jgi:hypothetical protein